MDDEQVQEAVASLLAAATILVVIFAGSHLYDWYSYHANSAEAKQVTETYYKGVN